jgi:hypothetical protein
MSRRPIYLLLAGLLLVPILDPIICTIDALNSHEQFLVAHYDAGLLTWPSWVIWGICHLWLAGKALLSVAHIPREGRKAFGSWRPIHGVYAGELVAAHATIVWAGSHQVRLGVGFPSQLLIP